MGRVRYTPPTTMGKLIVFKVMERKEITVEELLQRYAAGERDFTGVNLSGVDLEAANLSGANLSNANLSRANLLAADLSGANLSGANLSNAKLSLTKLNGANLEGANVTDARIVGADLTGVNLRDTIGSFGHAHGALYHNTILSGGEIVVGPITEEG